MPAKTKVEIQADLDAASALIEALNAENNELDTENYDLNSANGELASENATHRAAQKMLVLAIDQLATDLYGVIEAVDDSRFVPRKIRKAVDAVRERFVDEDEIPADGLLDDLAWWERPLEDDLWDDEEPLAEWERELLASAGEVEE